jgi:hypothetical protein
VVPTGCESRSVLTYCQWFTFAMTTMAVPRSKFSISTVLQPHSYRLSFNSGGDGKRATHLGHARESLTTKAEPPTSYLFQIVEISDLARTVLSAYESAIFCWDAMAIVLDLDGIYGICSNVDEYALRPRIQRIFD